MSDPIRPGSSQFVGVCVSILVGLAVYLIVYVTLQVTLDFWYLDQVVAPAAGVALGFFSAFAMFTLRQFTVPLNWVGVKLLFNKPTGGIYENGTHWVAPFMGIWGVPAKTKKFIIPMPGEKINAQDGIAIFFGVSEKEHPGKHNRLQYSVVDPKLYIAVHDPEDSLREEFIEKARLFFGQVKSAIGVKNVKLLFDSYLLLPPKTAPDHEFRNKLTEARFVTTGKKSKDKAGEPVTERLFSDQSVETLMGYAGEFLETVAEWGIGDIEIFTPNVRENPEAEAAAAKKAAAIEDMDTLNTKAKKIKSLASGIAKGGVSPDLALTTVAKISGQDVKIENKTVTVSGLPEVIRELGILAITKLGNTKEKQDG